MAGWEAQRTALLYDRFARSHPLYQETSRDLVALAQLEGARLVVELACGTGVTTEVILARLLASAEVIALDFSAAMLAIAKECARC